MKKLIKNTAIKLINFILYLKNFGKKEKYDFNCQEKNIVIIIPSYNNEKWVKKCLDSVKLQDYKNFRVIYINDCSKDNTGELVAKYIQENNLNSNFTLINNTIRVGALENIYNAVHSCKNTEIVAILDGDDSLAHKNVLKIINSVYQNPNIWLTFGQYKAERGISWPSTKFSKRVITQNKFRYKGALISHFRTFYAGLFKLIKPEDLQQDGKFLQMTGDTAVMFPLIEMSGGKFKCINEILYIYNDTNPINDYKINAELQNNLSKMIMGKKPYKPIKLEEVCGKD